MHSNHMHAKLHHQCSSLQMQVQKKYCAQACSSLPMTSSGHKSQQRANALIRMKTCCLGANAESQASAVKMSRRAELAAAVLLPLFAHNQPAVAADNPSNSQPTLQPVVTNDKLGTESAGDDISPQGALPAIPLVSLSTANSGKQRRRARQTTSSSNVQVSQIIKGCWQLDGNHKGDPRTDRTSGRAALLDCETFVEAGMTTFDTADVWGPSEALIGQYLRLNPWQRQNVQIITHLTILAEDLPRLSKDFLQYRLRASSARLGVPSLDLVLLQWEEGLQDKGARGAGLLDAALWLADLQQEGMAKGIGVANLDVPTTLQVLDAGVPITAHQVQLSVLDRRPLLYMQSLARQRGFSLLATGCLSGGWLSKRWLGRPASKARLDTLSKAKHGAFLKQAGGWSWLQDTLQALQRVSLKHQVPISTVALRWVLQQQSVAAASVGARNASHIRSTQAAISFTLDEEDMLELDAAYEGCPNAPVSDVFAWERGGTW